MGVFHSLLMQILRYVWVYVSVSSLTHECITTLENQKLFFPRPWLGRMSLMRMFGLIKGIVAKCPYVNASRKLESNKSIGSAALKWERRKKSNEISSCLVRILNEFLDNFELVFTVTCALVGGDSITRHALVRSASTIVARYIISEHRSYLLSKKK